MSQSTQMNYDSSKKANAEGDFTWNSLVPSEKTFI